MQNENNNKLKVTNDLIFQRIFGKVGNERITKGFLEKVLNIKIDKITLNVNKRLIGEMHNDKLGRIDIRADLEDGTKVIIEMQVAGYDYMPKRFLEYWAKVYVEGFKRGDNYDELKKTIGILILVENLKETEEIEDYHVEWGLMAKKQGEREVTFTKDIEIHTIELKKFKEEEERPEKNWIKFIGGKLDMRKWKDDPDEELKEAIKELEMLEASPELREEYEERERDLKDKISIISSYKKNGLREGREEGRKEGRKENQKLVVINMYKKNMKITDICEVTGLKREEVEKIVEEIIN